MALRRFLPAGFGWLTRLHVVSLVVGALLLSACGDSAVQTTPAESPAAIEGLLGPAEAAGLTWLNQTGLNQTSPAVWQERIRRACSEDVSDQDVATRLAEEFLLEDAPLSVRDRGSPSIATAVESVVSAVLPVCPEIFD